MSKTAFRAAGVVFLTNVLHNQDKVLVHAKTGNKFQYAVLALLRNLAGFQQFGNRLNRGWRSGRLQCNVKFRIFPWKSISLCETRAAKTVEAPASLAIGRNPETYPTADLRLALPIPAACGGGSGQERARLPAELADVHLLRRCQ